MAEKRKGALSYRSVDTRRMAERAARWAQEARDRHQATQCEACSSCERAARNAWYAAWAERDHTIVVRPMTAREREQL